MLDATTSDPSVGAARTTSRAMRPSNGSSQPSTSASIARARGDVGVASTCAPTPRRPSRRPRRRARRAAARGRPPCARSRRAAGRATHRRGRPAPGRPTRSSHWTSGLLVVGPPTRNTTSGAVTVGEAGDAQQRVVGGDRARHPQVRERVGQHRPARDLGEAQHRRRSARRRPSRRRPGRGAGRRRGAASASSISTDGARTPGAVAVHGRSSERPGASTSASPVGHQRLAERQVEVHRSRRRPARVGDRARRQRAPRRAGTVAVARAPRLRGTSGPRRRRASPGRRSGPRRCRAAPAAGRRCTRSAGRARGALRAPPGGSWRRRCPTCTARPRDDRWRVARPSAKNDAERSSRCTCSRMRSSPASASASGAEREPGARQASVTPWRAHSSTNVRAKAVVASRRHGRMPLVMADRRCSCTASRRRRRRGLRCPQRLDVAGALGRGSRLVPTSRPWRHALDDGRPRTYVGYSLGGRLCLQLALDRPDVVHATRAGERVARDRRRRRARRRAVRPTSGWRRRSSATASTRSSNAGSRSRCSPRCHPSGRGSTNDAPPTPSSPSPSSCACSARARNRRTGSASASCGCRCC